MLDTSFRRKRGVIQLYVQSAKYRLVGHFFQHFVHADAPQAPDGIHLVCAVRQRFQMIDNTRWSDGAGKQTAGFAQPAGYRHFLQFAVDDPLRLQKRAGFLCCGFERFQNIIHQAFGRRKVLIGMLVLPLDIRVDTNDLIVVLADSLRVPILSQIDDLVDSGGVYRVSDMWGRAVDERYAQRRNHQTIQRIRV